MTEEEKKADREQRERWHAQLNDKAAEWIDAMPGNLRGAAERMAEDVRKNPTLRDAIFELMVLEQCHERIRRVLQGRNQKIWYANEPKKNQGWSAKRLKDALYLRAERLLDYNLRRGLTLGDCTRRDLAENAEKQREQAVRMTQTAAFLMTVMEELPNDTVRVRDVVSEERLRELQIRVRKAYGEDGAEVEQPSVN